MENTFSYEQIVAIIRLLTKLCDIDDKSTAEERAVIMQVLHAAFEDSVSIVEAVNDAKKCDIETALGRISQLEPEKKQTVSELAFAVLVADGELTNEEALSIFALHNQYDLPLPKAVAEGLKNAEESQEEIPAPEEEVVEESAAEEEAEEEEEEEDGYENVDPVFPVIRYTSYSRNMLDGELVLLPEGEDAEETVFGYFDNPKNLQFWRTSRVLDLMNAKLELPEDTHITMIFFKPGLFGAKGEPNKCGTLVAEKKVTGPVLFALEDSEGVLYGFPDKELLQDLMDWLDALANHVLLADGDGAEAVSAKNMELALEAIDALE